jgi:hypothetical protein
VVQTIEETYSTMDTDIIDEVSIDAEGRLHVKPASAAFPQIYREAMEVHWDPGSRTLYSPTPREWSYARWFKQILAAAKEQSCHLQLSKSTQWRNVPQPVQDEIAAWLTTLSYSEDAKARGCYCGLWDTKPDALRDQGLPEGFCGQCEKCGMPGHTRHFPGPVPYTGSWCDKHYRRLFLLDPRTGTGCLAWIGLIALIALAVRMLHGGG